LNGVNGTGAASGSTSSFGFGLRQIVAPGCIIGVNSPKMVIRIALAHKLLVRLNAKTRETRLTFANQA
jgi:hypothetical protein